MIQSCFALLGRLGFKSVLGVWLVNDVEYTPQRSPMQSELARNTRMELSGKPCVRIGYRVRGVEIPWPQGGETAKSWTNYHD